jgi:hypothetical protein
MLKQLASDDVEPCTKCNGLVGASRGVPPHFGLLREDKGPYYTCLRCGVLWRLGRLGWARVVRSAEEV